MYKGNLAIVTELVEHNLQTIVLNPHWHLSTVKRLQMARDCAFGLNWLHCCDPAYIHGDIRPSNFWLDSNERVKICDFGLAEIKDTKMVDNPPKAVPAVLERRDARFYAPEVLKGQPRTEKSDVYSFGMLLHFVLTRELPYNDLEGAYIEDVAGKRWKLFFVLVEWKLLCDGRQVDKQERSQRWMMGL
tara:strand:- start:208 stop:771 length:564 start_codon:yes stop_codon:yes gene_type:complete